MRDLWNPTPQHRGSCKIQGIPEFVYTSTPRSEESQQEDPGEEKKGSGYLDTNKVSAVWRENMEKTTGGIALGPQENENNNSACQTDCGCFPGIFQSHLEYIKGERDVRKSGIGIE